MPSNSGEDGPEGPGGEPRLLLFLSLAGGLALLAAALLVLAPLAPAPVSSEEVARELSLLEWSDLRPEPRERFLYIAGVVLSPSSSSGATWRCDGSWGRRSGAASPGCSHPQAPGCRRHSSRSLP